MKKEFTKTIVLAAGGFLLLLTIAACSILSGLQVVDSQSATLTALITPTVVQPTLDLKGNQVLEDQSCQVSSSASISTFDDAENGGIFRWADDQDLFAYVAPENRYWGWFSGDAVVLDFKNAGQEPSERTTNGVNVFGDFAFSPDSRKLAFVAFRPSDKVYTVMVSDIDSELQSTIDLFSGISAETDEYSSSKSVIGWVSNNKIRVATSCGIDCERIMIADIDSGQLTLEEEVRKNGHEGRTFPQHVIEYDDREYPVMNQANWSPDDQYVFYTDTQGKTWILNDRENYQFELPVSGDTVLQSLWSADEQYIALRFSENIIIFKVQCK
jgi:Tol biopolymer transport system component